MPLGTPKFGKRTTAPSADILMRHNPLRDFTFYALMLVIDRPFGDWRTRG
jgi:hypothetical protein